MVTPRRHRILVVLGMHRGGTSAVAGMLHCLGVNFGPRLMPANGDNPAGYYEHNDIVNLHDRFLGRLGAAWDDPFPPEYDDARWATLSPGPNLPTYREELLSILRRDFTAGEQANSLTWGLKDPRLCLLLPWWELVWGEMGLEPHFIIVLRSPDAVAASLSRRDGFSLAKSNLLWLQHLLCAEQGTRGRSRCFLDYDTFLSDWRGTMERVERTLIISWPRSLKELSQEETSFLDPALRHHLPPAPDVPETRGEIQSWVKSVQALMSPDGPGGTVPLDKVHDELRRAQGVALALSTSGLEDAKVQLRSQRRLTLWYEEEWQKAAQKLVEFEDRLQKKDLKIRALQTRLNGGADKRSQ